MITPKPHPMEDLKPPCTLCNSLCCRKESNQSECGEQNVAVLLDSEEINRFTGLKLIITRDNDIGIPYNEKGNCVFLEESNESGNNCSLVRENDDRPNNCRGFDCSKSLNPKFDETNLDEHGFFLRDNPHIIKVIREFNGLSTTHQ